MSEPMADYRWTVYKTGSALNARTGAVDKIIETVPSDGFNHDIGRITHDMRSECVCGPKRDTTRENVVAFDHQAIDGRNAQP